MNILRKRVLIYILTIFLTLMFIQTVYLSVKLKMYLNAEQNSKKEVLIYSTRLIHHLTDFAYDVMLNRYDVRKLMSDFDNNSSEKDRYRIELYEKLISEYINLSKHGIEQLQFHTKDDYSMLRFSHPSLYGDDLRNIRDTVVYVNSTLKPIDGFEVGRLLDGWRYIYPMFDNCGNHIGSVGITSSTLSLKKMLEKRGPFSVDFLIYKNIAEKKILPQEFKRYSIFKWNSNFVEYKKLIDYDRVHYKTEYKNELFSKVIDEQIKRKMNRGEEFHILTFDSFIPHIIYFIPLKNPVTSKHVGYLVITERNSHIYYMMRYYYMMIIVLLVFSVITGILIYKQLSLKESRKRVLELYRMILDFTENMIVIYSNGKVESMNRAFKNFIGEIDTVDIDLCSMMDSSLDGSPPCSMSELIERIKKDGTLIVFMKNRKSGYTEEFEVVKHNIDEKSERYIIEFKNISNIFEQNIELQRELFHDYLTGLLNRKAFDGALLKAIQGVKKGDGKRSVIMIDIDNFKKINDSFGHETGDKSLKFLADILRSSLRRGDLVFRWGGEEFMVLVNADGERAEKIAEFLREQIESATLQDVKIPSFTCSFGVVEIDDTSTILNTLSRVDKALYRAKGSGRNRVMRG